MIVYVLGLDNALPPNGHITKHKGWFNLKNGKAQNEVTNNIMAAFVVSVFLVPSSKSTVGPQKFTVIC